MAGIGEASAILGVAQLGLQLASALVTIIGDYRDAATNINRLRDEVHLTSISLQQLGVLAADNRLLPGRGVLEATNLRERCRAVIWEIRTVIRPRGQEQPLGVDEVKGEEIDVSYFTAWKWALWTKKHLEGPRGELDRLKGSLTLVFVTHMAIVGEQGERDWYRKQIPGNKRYVDWAEEKYRDDEDDEEKIPDEVLGIDPREWRRFLEWRAAQKDKDDISGSGQPDREPVGTASNSPLSTPVLPAQPATGTSKYECWSLDPMVGQTRLPMTSYTQQDRSQLLRIWTRLDPWYTKQVDELLKDLSSQLTHEWFVVGLKLVHQPLLRRVERPPSLQVFLRGDVRTVPITVERTRLELPQTKMGGAEDAVPYTDTIPVNMPGDEDEEWKLSDEEIIERQLRMYQQQDV